MSYMCVYFINKDGKAVPDKEYRNSHGYDPRIWSALCEKYGIGSWFSEFHANKLWKLADNPAIPWFERVALGTTFDRAIIKKTDIPIVMAALTEFEKAHPAANHVNHIPEVISDLERLAKEDIIGVCFYPTSTIENWWYDYDINESHEHHFVPCTGFRQEAGLDAQP